MLEREAVDAVQRPLARPAYRNDPFKTAEPLVSHAEEQSFADLHRGGKHPVKFFGIPFGKSLFTKYLAGLRTRKPLSSPEQIFLGLLGAHGGAGEREGGDEGMGYPAAPTAHAKNFNPVLEVIFAVHRVTSKAASLAAVRAAPARKQPSPFMFEEASAIVFCRTVEYYNC